MNLLSRIATAESYYFSLGFMEKSSLVRLVRKEVMMAVNAEVDPGGGGVGGGGGGQGGQLPPSLHPFQYVVA